MGLALMNASSPRLRYKSIVKYKTAFYSFYLPVAAAMYMVSQCRPHCCPVGFGTGRHRVDDWDNPYIHL